MRKLNLLGLSMLVILPLTAFANTGSEEYYHHKMMSGWSGMMMGPLMMIIMLVIVVIVMILVLRWIGVIQPAKTADIKPIEDTALDILNKRFANGDIDKKEFEEKRALLNN